MKQENTVHLTCCICGDGAGKYVQHWNRDDGYGICPSCVAFEMGHLPSETVKSYYGQIGINYGQPTVRHLGRRYNVLAATKDQDQANAFMAQHEEAAVLLVFDDGTITLADKSDAGQPI